MSGSPPAVSRLLVVAGGPGGLRLRQACGELGLTAILADGSAEALVARAREAGCQALHPGEEDAAEQLALAEACRRAGLRFLGPPATLLGAMAEGGGMRQRMREAGLPLAAAAGRELRMSLLADGQGRVVYLAPRQRLHEALSVAPLGWLTAERGAYLGRLAGQGVAALGLTGLVEVRFRVDGNRLGFAAMAPGLTGEEALDEALTGLDPVVEQLRVLLGGRLRERQPRLAPQGHARLWHLSLLPATRLSGGPGLRLDRARGEGGARLLAWGRRAEEARDRARRGLVELLGEAETARLALA
ncbi:biotin carboxylase N-terminal domain-containing protein [Halomonas maura]|uniref:biotin carboxylase N-terminal domain-containing protein n=1 Tax=Halomonas maura TaxID=117606 RepID=UPI0025B4B73B|nr:biotin carboxylase N-terminal domain-containing protein [Halomonas maura]MDN3555295.1 biotin carboxylase N-terminal domain-containing protein [Halomonas maura]